MSVAEKYKDQSYNPLLYIDLKDKISQKTLLHMAEEDLIYETKEYILKECVTKYHYGIRRDESGKAYEVYSPGREELGDVIKSFRGDFCTDNSRVFGDREQAEYQGFQSIEEEIFSGRGSERFFVWVSMPGKKEDGYGDYSYTFIGQVLDDRLNMVAYRNNVKRSENINFLNKFLPEKQRLEISANAVDMLSKPVWLDKYAHYTDIIRDLDSTYKNSDGKKEEDILEKLTPFRKAVVSAIEMGDLESFERAKRAHDNYALALFKDKDQVNLGFDRWASMAAVSFSGSCGKSGFKNRERKFGGGLTYLGMQESQYFCKKCPNCNTEINCVVLPGENCPAGCGAKRECA